MAAEPVRTDPQVRPTAPLRVLAPPVPRTAVLRGLVRAARPHQWVKNLLVLAAPVSAGVTPWSPSAGRVVAALAAFCLAASATYLLNDARDVEADRLHPRKRHRPVAAGIVPVPLAVSSGGVLAGGALVLAGLLVGPWLVAVVLGYLALTTLYSTWLKHLPIWDISAIAGGFVLRAVAGAVAAAVPVSDWFLLVVSFGALTVAAGKRLSEQGEVAETDRRAYRATLTRYTRGFLQRLLTTTTTATIVTYCLWAIGTTEAARDPWRIASIAPVLVAVLHYGLVADRGEAGAPDELILRDRTLQVLGVIWATLLVISTYLTPTA